jgi:hypothetical protein
MLLLDGSAFGLRHLRRPHLLFKPRKHREAVFSRTGVDRFYICHKK